MSEVKLLPLPKTMRHPGDKDIADHVQSYAIDCVKANLAERDAEVEALRAEVELLRMGVCGDACLHIAIERDQLKSRAERLAGALRECRPFVAYAFDQGIVGADAAGLALDAALEQESNDA